MVDVRSVSPILMSGTHFLSISGNQHQQLQALTKDISTPADIAPTALETIIFYCFMGYISALTYYLLLIAMAGSSSFLQYKLDPPNCRYKPLNRILVVKP